MNRAEVLESVKKTICKDRNDQHGEPENSFPLIAAAWTAYLQDFGYMPTDKALKPSDVASLMAEFKECRYRINPANADNRHDQIGYLAIAVELMARERAPKVTEPKMPNEPELEKVFPNTNRVFLKDNVTTNEIKPEFPGELIELHSEGGKRVELFKFTLDGWFFEKVRRR